MAGKLATVKTHVTASCKYHGFIHVDLDDPAGRPNPDAVRTAYEMLSKRNIKKTRKLHPLFGRGFDTPLNVRVTNQALRVSLPALMTKEGKEAIVLNTQLHKIALSAVIGSSIGLVIKRAGLGKFKCHLFELDTPALAADLCTTIQKVTTEAFKMLRQVTTKMRKQELSVGPPDLPARGKTVVNDEEQPWFHGAMGRERAEEVLMGFAACDGLFLVRASDRSNDMVISFFVAGVCFHNKMEKVPTGFKNSKSTVFPNMSTAITLYSGRHPDMQVPLTEYVPRERADKGGVEYANATVLREGRHVIEANVRTAARWKTMDLQAALTDIDNNADDDPTGYDGSFDPIYDDVRFGFGNEFVSFVFGTGEVEEPTKDASLDDDVFNLSST